MGRYDEFWDAFAQLTAGETQAKIARRLRFTVSYVGQLKRRMYERPSRELVERVIEAYGVDRDRWLTLAGYMSGASPYAAGENLQNVVDQAVLKSTLSINGAQRFAQGLFELSRRFNRAIPVYLQGGAETLTVEEADRLLADFEQQMLEEDAETRPT